MESNKKISDLEREVRLHTRRGTQYELEIQQLRNELERSYNRSRKIYKKLNNLRTENKELESELYSYDDVIDDLIKDKKELIRENQNLREDLYQW